MKKFFAALVVGFCLIGHAEQVVKTDMICEESKIWFSTLQKNGLSPAFVGDSELHSGKPVKIIVWMDAKNERVIISETLTQGTDSVTCIGTSALNVKNMRGKNL